MAMMHNSLIAHYERIFALKQYHNWTLMELDDLLPWELDVVTSLLNNYLEYQDAQRKQAAANR